MTSSPEKPLDVDIAERQVCYPASYYVAPERAPELFDMNLMREQFYEQRTTTKGPHPVIVICAKGRFYSCVPCSRSSPQGNQLAHQIQYPWDGRTLTYAKCEFLFAASWEMLRTTNSRRSRVPSVVLSDYQGILNCLEAISRREQQMTASSNEVVSR
jgi:hypothetical protein